MDNKKMMAAVRIKEDAGVNSEVLSKELAECLEQNQADGLLILDQRAAEDACEEDLIRKIKSMSAASDLLVSVMQTYRRFEDAKKMIYAGAAQVVMPYEGVDREAVILESAARFGSQTALYISEEMIPDEAALARLYEKGVREAYMSYKTFKIIRDVFLKSGIKAVIADDFSKSDQGFLCTESIRNISGVLSDEQVTGVADESIFSDRKTDISDMKHELKNQGIAVNVFESSIPFSEFKLNSDGLIPVIVQDYKSGKVLMLAYMNEASYNETLRSGRMTYFSRSRQELWKKGETSGHYQFVKSIDIDCDKDTMLAKVAQVGAACHTGNASCFYTNLVKKEYDDVNPLTIFDELMETILERKVHPKEGSYTNYLFDKGVDKILKKVGEEATEIVIAAKNPDASELKYEICDFLYHMMVLMADKDVTWKEITRELAARH